MGKITLGSAQTILYSVRLDDRYTKEVALVMIMKMGRTLIECKPSGWRLLKARLDSKYPKMKVIVCYAPTAEEVRRQTERVMEGDSVERNEGEQLDIGSPGTTSTQQKSITLSLGDISLLATL